MRRTPARAVSKPVLLALQRSSPAGSAATSSTSASTGRAFSTCSFSGPTSRRSSRSSNSSSTRSRARAAQREYSAAPSGVVIAMVVVWSSALRWSHPRRDRDPCVLRLYAARACLRRDERGGAVRVAVEEHYGDHPEASFERIRSAAGAVAGTSRYGSVSPGANGVLTLTDVQGSRTAARRSSCGPRRTAQRLTGIAQAHAGAEIRPASCRPQ